MKRSTAEDMTWIRTDDLSALRAQLADLELQHVGDKATIEALNERVGELEGYIQDTNDTCCEIEDKNQILRNDLAAELRLRQHFQSEVSTFEAQLKLPPMTRELPTCEGDFWYRRDGEKSTYPVTIYISGGRTHWRAHSRAWLESLPLEEVEPGYWSARPIEMDEIPKEVE